MKKITIAIDGYSSCGKSTMAKGLAKEIGYVYVDTGAMYRAVTLFAIRNGLFNADKSVNESGIEAHLNDIKISFRRNEADGQMVTCLNGEPVETEIRSMQVAELVSRIAALPAVRKALVEQQRSMGKEKGVVGRQRHRYGGVSRCRTEGVRHGFARGKGKTTLRRDESQRQGCRLQRHT